MDSSSDDALACKIKFIAALMLALEIELDETTENFQNWEENPSLFRISSFENR